MKDKHVPNEVGFGVGNTGKPGNTNLHPGAPQRNTQTGRHGQSFFPSEPTQREKNQEKATKVADVD